MAGEMGSFIAGSIVGKLLLDKTGWNQSIRSVTDDGKKLVGMSDEVAKGFTRTGTIMTAVGGAILGVLGSMVKKTADAGDAIYDMSQRTGIATEILSGYKLAAEKSGTSLEGFATGMRGLSRVMDDANRGGKEARSVFASLGVQYVDNMGKLRPLNDVMLDVAERLSQMPDGAQKTAVSMQVLGRSGMDLIPMFNMGKKGLEENYEATRRLGGIWSKDAAQAADRFNDSLAELKAGVGGVGKELVLALLPSIKGLNEFLIKVVSGVRSWIAEHPTLSGWIAKIVLGLSALMTTVIGPLLIALPRLISGFQQLRKIEFGKMIAGQFKGLKDNVTGLSQVLGRLPAIGAAAFAGWKIGKVLGEVTGLDHAIEGLTTKIINKFGLWQGSAVLVRTETERVAKTQELLAEATKKAGREITNIHDAVRILSGRYKIVGDEIVKVEAKTKSAIPVLKMIREIIETPIPAGRDMSGALAEFSAEITETALPAARNFGDAVADVMPKVATEIKTMATSSKSFIQEVSTVFSDAMRNIGRAIVDTFGVGRLLVYQGKEFNDEYFKDALADVDAEYEARHDSILKNITDEANRAAALDDLEKWREWERKRIQTDEDKARDDFVKREEDRQNSLWTKVKGIVGTAADEMLNIMLTRFLSKLADKITGTLTETMSGAAKSVAGAVGGITQGAAGAISGLWTGLGAAVGTFLGTLLAGVIKGGPSGHQQQQQINDTKDMRNFLAEIRNWFFSAGSGFGGASYEFITGHLGDWLGWIKDAINDKGNALWNKLDEIKRVLQNIPGAQQGLVMRSPGLVMTHGTPFRPEIVAPLPTLQSMAIGKGSGPAPVDIKIEVNMKGVIVTNRDHVRDMILPEMITALESHYLKSKIQKALGVA